MGVTYNKRKFRELIIYVSERFADDPGFGDTKLNKILHFSDLFAYNKLGHAITGARYQKLEFGPGAVPLLPVRRELEEEGAVHVEKHGLLKKRTVTIAERPAEREVFEAAELEIVDELIELFRKATAEEVSRFSHDFSGWRLADIKEDIPYETGLVPAKVDASDEVKSRGRQLAESHGW